MGHTARPAVHHREAEPSDTGLIMKTIDVEIRSLERREAELLLSHHHTGRMAFAFHDRITIELVNYVYADGWIYARIEHGPALTTLQHHQWVAFEVDELKTVYDWR